MTQTSLCESMWEVGGVIYNHPAACSLRALNSVSRSDLYQLITAAALLFLRGRHRVVIHAARCFIAARVQLGQCLDFIKRFCGVYYSDTEHKPTSDLQQPFEWRRISLSSAP